MSPLLAAHLPQLLCRQLEVNCTCDAALAAAVLHVEIPGLSAALDAFAPADKLSRGVHLDAARAALNALFGDFVSTLQQWGADVWSLDALSHGTVTALWAERAVQRGGGDEISARLIERAGACAAVLRECHPRFDLAPGVSLGVWIGLSFGPLSVVDLDADGDRRVAILAGDPLARLHQMGFPHPEPSAPFPKALDDEGDPLYHTASVQPSSSSKPASPRRAPTPPAGGLVVCSRAWGVLSALSFFSGRSGHGGHFHVDSVLPSAFLHPAPPFPADLYPPNARDAPHLGRALRPYMPAVFMARAASAASLAPLQSWAAEGSLTSVVYLRVSCHPPSLHEALASGDQRFAREAALSAEAALRAVHSALEHYDGTMRSFSVDPNGDGFLVASFELHGRTPGIPFAPGSGHHPFAHISPVPHSPSPSGLAVDDSMEVEGDEFGNDFRSVSPETHAKSVFLPFAGGGDGPHSARQGRLQSPAARAVGAVLEARQRLRDIGMRASAGVGTGLVAQFPVGTDLRRSYGLVGRAVALASRLLEASRDEVLCDEATRVGAGSAVRFEQASIPDAGDGAAAVRGRLHSETHLAALLRGGRGGLVLVEGPEGSGKTRLLDELGRLAGALLQRCARGELPPAPPACPPWTSASAVRLPPAPYGPWRAVFRQLLALPAFTGALADLAALCGAEEAAAAPPRAAGHGALSTVVDLSVEAAPGDRDRERERERERAPRPLFVPESEFFRANPDLWRLAPLLADLLPPDLAEAEESEFTRGMRREAREDAAREAAVRLLEHASADAPLLVLLDGDASRLDGPSAALLEAALKRCGALLAVVATRRPVLGETAPGRRSPLGRAAASLTLHGRDVAAVRLPALPLADTASLVALRLQVPRVPGALGSAVWAASGGVALLAELIAFHLRDTLPDLKKLLELPEGAPLPREVGELPATLEAAAEARIRRLAAPEVAALEAAAVAGWAFSLQHLFHLLGARTEKDRALAYDHLAALLQADLPKARGGRADAPPAAPPALYGFRHECVWAAAYGRIDAARRGELHAASAAFLELRKGAEPAPDACAMHLHCAPPTPRAALGQEEGGLERDPQRLQRSRALALVHAERAAAAARRCGAHGEAAPLYARLLHLSGLPAAAPARELWRWPAPSAASEAPAGAPPAAWAWEAALSESLLRVGQAREAAAALRRALRLAGHGARPRTDCPCAPPRPSSGSAPASAAAPGSTRGTPRRPPTPPPARGTPPPAPRAHASTAASPPSASTRATRGRGRTPRCAPRSSPSAPAPPRPAARPPAPSRPPRPPRCSWPLPPLAPAPRQAPPVPPCRPRPAGLRALRPGAPLPSSDPPGRELPRDPWDPQMRGLVPPPVPTAPRSRPRRPRPADADGAAAAALAAASFAIANARFREAAEAAIASAALFEAQCDRVRREESLCVGALADLATGGYARASLAAEEVAASARLRGDPAAAFRACLVQVHCQLPRGRLEEASSLLQSAEALFGRGSPAGTRPVASEAPAPAAALSHADALRALIAHRSGDAAAAVALAVAAVGALAAQLDPAATAARARRPAPRPRRPAGPEEDASRRRCRRRAAAGRGRPRARGRAGAARRRGGRGAGGGGRRLAGGGLPVGGHRRLGPPPLSALAEVLLTPLLASSAQRAAAAGASSGEMPAARPRAPEALPAGVEAHALEWACRTLVSWLLGIGRLLPVAIPPAEYWLGVLYASSGRLAEAKRQWKLCIRGAEKAGMLREVGLGHLAIARHAASSAESARHHTARAADAFGKIEASHDLALCLA
eukprot:tig00021281_g19928.t1